LTKGLHFYILLNAAVKKSGILDGNKTNRFWLYYLKKLLQNC